MNEDRNAILAFKFCHFNNKKTNKQKNNNFKTIITLICALLEAEVKCIYYCGNIHISVYYEDHTILVIHDGVCCVCACVCLCVCVYVRVGTYTL